MSTTTTQLTAWAHLPNAHHIDRILLDLKQRPQAWADAFPGWTPEWSAAWDAAWAAARDAAWRAAWDAVLDAARDAARDAAWGAARDDARGAAWGAAWGAILALVAWDDAGDLLDMPPDAVRLLAASGHTPAVLLLPAVIALSEPST